MNLEHLNRKHLDTLIYPYNNYIFNIYLIEDEIDINNIVYDFSEVVNIDWYTKEEIFNKLSDMLVEQFEIEKEKIVSNFYTLRKTDIL